MEELPCLLAQGLQLRLPKSADVVTATAASQGRRAGGIESIADPQIVGQFRRRRKRLGVEACRRGIVVLDETEFRYVQALRRSGLLFSLHDAREATFKSKETFTAFQLGFQVAAEVFVQR